ncbi:Ras-related protein YPTC6 [Tritrichomonas foetus]|uniref:Ras-related protein YPTC6 n=1 Tax=Tritrichomonas foetus TaxID=1144522 RepID=A0A1J4K1K0_9EUKA|nr:Ras-related protein YPTC6 [Tritrichomonas foetus]|eukprot:OHT05263.1 Ras-related protein YPTC6 [Tritrichomonas foetus]
MSDTKPTASYKVILCGNHQSGKTLFLAKLTDPDGQFTGQTQATVATNLICHRVSVGDSIYKLQLWDTAGQEAFHSITASYFRSCQGVFLLFDVTDLKSFRDLDYWMRLIKDHANEMPLVVLIANKNDLPGNDDPDIALNGERKSYKREVDNDMISNFCNQHGISFFLTSAVTGENVQNAVDFMVRKLSENRRNRAQVEEVALSRAQGRSCC